MIRNISSDNTIIKKKIKNISWNNRIERQTWTSYTRILFEIFTLHTLCCCSMATRGKGQGSLHQKIWKENPVGCTGEGRRWKGSVREGWRECKTGPVSNARQKLSPRKFISEVRCLNALRELYLRFFFQLEGIWSWCEIYFGLWKKRNSIWLTIKRNSIWLTI